MPSVGQTFAGRGSRAPRKAVPGDSSIFPFFAVIALKLRGFFAGLRGEGEQGQSKDSRASLGAAEPRMTNVSVLSEADDGSHKLTGPSESFLFSPITFVAEADQRLRVKNVYHGGGASLGGFSLGSGDQRFQLQ